MQPDRLTILEAQRQHLEGWEPYTLKANWGVAAERIRNRLYAVQSEIAQLKMREARHAS